MKRNVEILAPAGSYESMRAAVAAGADAVYMGGSRFGARAYADNPDEEGLLSAIDYAHLHGCRLYMTVNTLVKEGEMDSLYEYLLPYYKQGVDAAIVQDMGVFSFLREFFPLLPIHASTQMTVTGPRGAALLMEQGASRIVTARELSLEEIRRIYRETGVEIESFVHGALCYCYSGQCLLSSLIGGRSGNRGRCAQTCRLPFEVKEGSRSLNKRDERYVLSLKDLCTLDILPDILEAGVYSLKIEGRMKSPRYTAGVVRLYRKYADRYLESGREGYRVDPADRRELLDLFDRGGQTEGYYRQKNGRDMVVLKEKPAFREENRPLYQFLDKTYVEARLQEPVKGWASVREGEAASLTLSCQDRLLGETRTVTVCGAAVQAAKNQPLTEERLEKQFKKTGNTPFYFESLELDVAGAPFLPLQELNELRREGFGALHEALLRPYRREERVEKTDSEEPGAAAAAGSATDDSGAAAAAGSATDDSGAAAAAGIAADDSGAAAAAGIAKDGSGAADNPATGNPASGRTAQADSPAFSLSVSLEDPDLLETVLAFPEVEAVYLDSAGFPASGWKEAAARCHQAGKSVWLIFPAVYRADTEAYFTGRREVFEAAGFDGAVLRSWEEFSLLEELAPQLLLLADFNLYAMNRRARRQIAALAPGRELSFALPVELNSRELAELGCGGAELLAYGRLPLMVTAQCVKKTADRCTGKPEVLRLRDRMGKEFPVKNHCRFCFNTIYNSSPLSLLGEKKRFGELGVQRLRLAFTVENRKQCQEVLKAFAGVFLHGQEARLEGDFTKGHFKRGVE